MIKNATIGGRSNRALLALGLLLGLLAAVLTAVYLGSAGGDSGGGTSGGGATVPVVVAAQDIAAGTRIEASMVRVGNVPESVLLPNVFGSTEEVVGQVTRVQMIAGEQVVASRITGSEFASEFGANPPLALLVPEGMRAVSIKVSSLAGAGGLIRPGDFVDVILSLTVDVRDEEGESIGRNQVAGTILQNVQVLALDQEITEAVPQGDEEGGTQVPAGTVDIQPDAATATLLVSPVHGEVLALADICRQNFSGGLSLALRGFGDDEAIVIRGEWPEDGPPPDCAGIMGITALQ